MMMSWFLKVGSFCCRLRFVDDSYRTSILSAVSWWCMFWTFVLNIRFERLCRNARLKNCFRSWVWWIFIKREMSNKIISIMSNTRIYVQQFIIVKHNSCLWLSTLSFNMCRNISTLQLMLRNTSYCIQAGFEPGISLSMLSYSLPSELLCFGLYIWDMKNDV